MDIAKKKDWLFEDVSLDDHQKKFANFFNAIDVHEMAEIAELEKQTSLKTATGKYLDSFGRVLGVNRESVDGISGQALQNDTNYRSLLEIYYDLLWNGLTRRTIEKIADYMGLVSKMNVYIDGAYITYCFHSLTQTELNNLKNQVDILKLFRFGLLMEVNASLATSFRFNVSFGKLAETIHREF